MLKNIVNNDVTGAIQSSSLTATLRLIFCLLYLFLCFLHLFKTFLPLALYFRLFLIEFQLR